MQAVCVNSQLQIGQNISAFQDQMIEVTPFHYEGRFLLKRRNGTNKEQE